MSNDHIEKLTELAEVAPSKIAGDFLSLARWMRIYNLEQIEVADTFNISQPAVSKMLVAERDGKRTFYIVEEPSDYWNLLEVSKRHSGKFTWL